VIRLVHAEFIKLRTTQVWFWLLLAAVAVTVIFVVASLAPHDAIKSDEDVYNVFTAGGTSYVVAFVLGALGVTTEFRYQTITSTVLATPSRWAIVSAKMITYAIVGAIYALICVIIQVAIALPWFSSKGIDVSLTSPHIPRTLLGVFGVVALFGIVGLGFGALVRNQIVAVTVGVIWLLILNGVLSVIPGVRVVYPYTPVGAVAAIFRIVGDRTVDNVTLLPAAAAAALLVAYAVAFAVVGASLTMNRDIT
jgi:ABC-type transport system involved in multi-copper enzyme maturation permease subunit